MYTWRFVCVPDAFFVCIPSGLVVTVSHSHCESMRFASPTEMRTALQGDNGEPKENLHLCFVCLFVRCLFSVAFVCVGLVLVLVFYWGCGVVGGVCLFLLLFVRLSLCFFIDQCKGRPTFFFELAGNSPPAGFQLRQLPSNHDLIVVI